MCQAFSRQLDLTFEIPLDVQMEGQPSIPGAQLAYDVLHRPVGRDPPDAGRSAYRGDAVSAASFDLPIGSLMLPVLQLGPFAIQTYPLALVLAGWLALAVARARRLGLDGDHIYNAGLYGLLAGIIAGRSHVLAFLASVPVAAAGDFRFNTTAFLLWPAICGAVAVAGGTSARKLPLVALLDAFAPGLLTGLAVAAIGALLTGRNPGAPAICRGQ